MKNHRKIALYIAATVLLSTCFILLCMQVAFCAVLTNIVQNGNMESGAGSTPANWTSGGTGGTATWATNNYNSPTHALEIVMPASGSCYWTQSVAVNPSINYSVEAEVYATNITPGSHYLYVEWYNGTTYLGINSVSSTAANIWENLAMPNLTPPAGSNTAYVQLWAYSAGTYYMDDAVMWPVQSRNLVQNANMESGSGTTPSDWAFTNSSNGTGNWATNNYVSGTHSLEIVMSATGSAYWTSERNCQSQHTLLRQRRSVRHQCYTRISLSVR